MLVSSIGYMIQSFWFWFFCWHFVTNLKTALKSCTDVYKLQFFTITRLFLPVALRPKSFGFSYTRVFIWQCGPGLNKDNPYFGDPYFRSPRDIGHYSEISQDRMCGPWLLFLVTVDLSLLAMINPVSSFLTLISRSLPGNILIRILRLY